MPASLNRNLPFAFTVKMYLRGVNTCYNTSVMQATAVSGILVARAIWYVQRRYLLTHGHTWKHGVALYKNPWFQKSEHIYEHGLWIINNSSRHENRWGVIIRTLAFHKMLHENITWKKWSHDNICKIYRPPQLNTTYLLIDIRYSAKVQGRIQELERYAIEGGEQCYVQ